jgi:ABC-type uncharacterized transport system ATPase subunit
VIEKGRHNAAIRLELADQVTPQQILEELVRQGVEVELFEVAAPTLEEIFVRVVKG